MSMFGPAGDGGVDTLVGCVFWWSRPRWLGT
ncbi:hypothetical protein Ae707Ps1_0068c [Pseudonocardia sp. Ae707_Ps1]|nr:hypothetical protein Ae707Ps1_0068c [Pseudonocardia sp. Ae707_Ps1]